MRRVGSTHSEDAELINHFPRLASALAIFFALGSACAQTTGIVESSCRTTAACRAEADNRSWS